ncbi:MAG: glycosyltransferase family 2 protein [Myxococcota bacterium]
MLSLVVPIYKNEDNIPPLLDAIRDLRDSVGPEFEAVFVVDGSPDNSLLALRRDLPNAPFQSQLVALSRNFGAFAAIRAGLGHARGDYCAVMAADLQEPPSLVLEMHTSLAADECDVALGVRASRNDPLTSQLSSKIFWWLYRKVVLPDIPAGGVDIFGINRYVKDQLLALHERNSSLVGLLFWVGFRRKAFPYDRQKRQIGVSAWTFAKKWRYMQDSIFSFSDLPIRLLLRVGGFGLLFSLLFTLLVSISWLLGQIDVPGYTATILIITLFGMLNLMSTGVLGVYIWRVFENTKGRPAHIVMKEEVFAGRASGAPETKDER